VQALGQCIFLPMLIIGGVAVPLASLPDWALHVSAFFPGRYAVDALQTAVTGAGLTGMRFSLLALVLIGAAGCLAGAKLFRWDAQQRFFQRQGKGWLAVALSAWLAVGALAEWRGRIALPADAEARPAAPAVGPAPVPAPVPPAFTPPSAPVTPPAPLTGWQTMTSKDLDALDFRVPPDGGVVSPFAPPDDEPIDFVADLVNGVRSKLPTWAPGAVKDEVQAVRNILFVAAVPDAVQLPVERYLPGVVLEHLVQRYPKEKLVKLLTWIAQHPEEGSVIDDISDLGIDGAAGDPLLVQERAYLYALKFLIRLTDRKPPN
jgi:hypothetical protein